MMMMMMMMMMVIYYKYQFVNVNTAGPSGSAV
jgi:hypothetical protein